VIVALNGSQSADVPLLSDSGTEWLTVADVPLRNYLLTA